MSSTPHFQGQSTLSELFTVVYILVDDYLKSSVQAGRFSLPIVDHQKGSYAELMSIALVGELRSQDHVGDWFDLVKVEYAGLFPILPHRSRYYRVLKRLERIFADFALKFAGEDTLHVIDSKPIPICLGQSGTFRACPLQRGTVETLPSHDRSDFRSWWPGLVLQLQAPRCNQSARGCLPLRHRCRP